MHQEQIVYVYKSSKKLRSYLYLNKKDVFSHLPSGLLDAFGSPQFVMMFALSKRESLPKVDINKLKESLEQKGYYLRIDLIDESENLLNQERLRLGLKPLEAHQMQEFFH